MENKTIEIIDSFAVSITNRLIDIRYFETNKIKDVLSVQLRMAMCDCLNVQIDDVQKAINTKKMQLTDAIGVDSRLQKRLQRELIELKEKRHEMQSTVNKIDIENRNYKREQALFITRELIFERFGKQALEEIKGECQRRMELKTLKDESSIS